MPARERFVEVLQSGVTVPVVRIRTRPLERRHEVHQLVAGSVDVVANRVDHHLADGHPSDAGRVGAAQHRLPGGDTAPDRQARVDRIALVGVELMADHRVDAVAADDDLAARRRQLVALTVDEVGGGSALVLVNTDAAVVGDDAVRPELLEYRLQEGDLHVTFLQAVLEQLGSDSVVTNHRCVRVDQDESGATAHFVDREGNELPSARGKVVIGCDGINSVIRHQFYPDEGDPVYSGLTIWRGVTPWQPVLSGANTARIGWMTVGKVMVYPIRDNIDAAGNQLMNFVATLERPRPDSYDWNSDARLEDFYEPFSSWHFDWLDVAKLLEQTEKYLVFPMVDRDPLPTWTFDRITLMGDAAHPMYPRGSNGAGQSILDARFMAGCIKRHGVNTEALQEYDRERVAATGRVVLANRANPPDAISRIVYERTGGKPFDDIDDVISRSELQAISDNYKKVAGFDI